MISGFCTFGVLYIRGLGLSVSFGIAHWGTVKKVRFRSSSLPVGEGIMAPSQQQCAEEEGEEEKSDEYDGGGAFVVSTSASAPSSSYGVLLLNLCDCADMMDASIRNDMVREVEGECGKWGNVLGVSTPKVPESLASSNESEKQSTPSRIYVYFDSLDVASRVARAFDQRAFEQRVISARLLKAGEKEGYEHDDADEPSRGGEHHHQQNQLDDSPSRSSRESATSFHARGAYEVGDFANACRLYTDTIRAEPSNAMLFVQRSKCHAALLLHDRASEDAATAVRMAPNSHLAHIQLGDVLTSQGRNAMAARSYAVAYKLKPDDVEIQARLRASLAAAKKSPGASVSLQTTTATTAATMKRNEHGLMRKV